MFCMSFHRVTWSQRQSPNVHNLHPRIFIVIVPPCNHWHGISGFAQPFGVTAGTMKRVFIAPKVETNSDRIAFVVYPQFLNGHWFSYSGRSKRTATISAVASVIPNNNSRNLCLNSGRVMFLWWYCRHNACISVIVFSISSLPIYNTTFCYLSQMDYTHWLRLTPIRCIIEIKGCSDWECLEPRLSDQAEPVARAFVTGLCLNCGKCKAETRQ
jgi:hypothetical protein